MSTVARYLLREFLAASALVLLALSVTWLAADSLLHLDDLGDGVGVLIASSFYRLLDVLPVSVPAACMVGVVWSLTRAVRSREITAIRCGGIPLRRALAPILGATLLLAFVVGWFQDRVVIQSRQARIEADSGRHSGGPRPELRNGRYWYADGRSIFVASGYDPESSTLLDVTLFDFSPVHAIRRHIEAQAALFQEGHSWELRDAIVREFSGPELSQSRVATLRVDLGLSSADLERARRPLSAESLHGLAKRLREGRPTDRERSALEASFHGRLAEPFAVVILVLLAIPFAVGDVERGDSLPRALLRAMLATGAFWVLWALGLLTARTGWLPPAFPIWGAVLLALAIGTWRYRLLRE